MESTKGRLRKQLEKEAPELYASLMRCWRIAEKEWLPAMPSKEGSFNSVPHLWNVEEHVDHVLAQVDGVDTKAPFGKLELSPCEKYLLLASVLFHDIGRILDKNGQHGTKSKNLIVKYHAHLGIENERLAEIIGDICEYHDHRKPETVYLPNLNIAPYGMIHVRRLAIILAFCDELDGAYKRVFPKYLPVKKEDIISGFRRNTTDVRVDVSSMTVITCVGIKRDELEGKEKEDGKENTPIKLDDTNVYLKSEKKFVSQFLKIFDSYVKAQEIVASNPTDNKLLEANRKIVDKWKDVFEDKILSVHNALKANEKPLLAKWGAFLRGVTDEALAEKIKVAITALQGQAKPFAQKWNSLPLALDPLNTKALEEEIKKLNKNGSFLMAEWETLFLDVVVLKELVNNIKSALKEQEKHFSDLKNAVLAKDEKKQREIVEKLKAQSLLNRWDTLLCDIKNDTSANLIKSLNKVRNKGTEFISKNLKADNVIVSFFSSLEYKESFLPMFLKPCFSLENETSPQYKLSSVLLDVGYSEIKRPEELSPNANLSLITFTALAAYVHSASRRLKDMKESLSRYGLPFRAWVLEYEEHLFTWYGCETFEASLSKDFLIEVADQMWRLSAGIFGREPFSYETLAAKLRDTHNNIGLVKTAVRRISIVMRHRHGEENKLVHDVIRSSDSLWWWERKEEHDKSDNKYHGFSAIYQRINDLADPCYQNPFEDYPLTTP